MRYQCIKPLVVSRYRDGREIDGSTVEAEPGTVWELRDAWLISEVRLESDTGWLEITRNSLEEYFKEEA